MQNYISNVNGIVNKKEIETLMSISKVKMDLIFLFFSENNAKNITTVS